MQVKVTSNAIILSPPYLITIGLEKGFATYGVAVQTDVKMWLTSNIGPFKKTELSAFQREIDAVQCAQSSKSRSAVSINEEFQLHRRGLPSIKLSA